MDLSSAAAKFNRSKLVTEKRCRACGQVRPAGEFYSSSNTRDLLSSYCKECHKVRMTEYLNKNRAKFNENQKLRARQKREAFLKIKEYAASEGLTFGEALDKLNANAVGATGAVDNEGWTEENGVFTGPDGQQWEFSE